VKNSLNLQTTSYSGFEKHKPQDSVFLKNRQAQKVNDFVGKVWISFAGSGWMRDSVLVWTKIKRFRQKLKIIF